MYIAELNASLKQYIVPTPKVYIWLEKYLSKRTQIRNSPEINP